MCVENGKIAASEAFFLYHKVKHGLSYKLIHQALINCLEKYGLDVGLIAAYAVDMPMSTLENNTLFTSY